MICLLSQTKKSVGMYNFIIDLEKNVTEYIIYEKEYALAQIEAHDPLLKKDFSTIEIEITEHKNEGIDFSIYPCFPTNAYNGSIVIYLFYLKKYNALKFGITKELSERSKRHFSTLGDKQGDVILVHVIATEHASSVENSLRTCVLEKGWKLQNIVIQQKKQTELID